MIVDIASKLARLNLIRPGSRGAGRIETRFLPMAPLALSLLTIAMPAQAAGPAGNLADGKTVYAQCLPCHTLVKGAASTIGPNLNGVVGRKVGSLAGFAYSPAMRGQAGAWTRDRLETYLGAPLKVIPGNRMPFAGLANPIDRKNVVAYIAAAK